MSKALSAMLGCLPGVGEVDNALKLIASITDQFAEGKVVHLDLHGRITSYLCIKMQLTLTQQLCKWQCHDI